MGATYVVIFFSTLYGVASLVILLYGIYKVYFDEDNQTKDDPIQRLLDEPIPGDIILPTEREEL